MLRNDFMRYLPSNKEEKIITDHLLTPTAKSNLNRHFKQKKSFLRQRMCLIYNSEKRVQIFFLQCDRKLSRNCTDVGKNTGNLPVNKSVFVFSFYPPSPSSLGLVLGKTYSSVILSTTSLL
jgi:hypothetical protein